MDNTIDLRFAVSDLVSARNISDVFPRLIKAAEVTLNQRLRTVWQIQEGTLYFDDGVASLPFDFLEAVTVKNAGRNLFAGPCTYQIGNGVVTAAGQSGEWPIHYYASLSSLTCSPLATNWLLQRYPNAYLYAVGLEAAKFLRDAEQATAIDALFGRELRAIKIDDDRARYSTGVVRVAGLTP